MQKMIMIGMMLSVAVGAVAAPVKTARTLLTPEKIAKVRADPGEKVRALR